MRNFDLTNDNKVAKNGIKANCKDYNFMINAIFNEMKSHDNTKEVIKAMNIRFCSDACKEGVNLPTFYIMTFSKYVDNKGNIYKKVKNEFVLRKLNGITAKGILRDALLNAVETCRKGNRFEQITIE